jgi:predicted RNA binding protein YcfA (HicA-like mRNA interferase family)
MKFSELVRLLEKNGFRVVKEKGSIRYCHAILKAAGIKDKD